MKTVIQLTLIILCVSFTHYSNSQEVRNSKLNDALVSGSEGFYQELSMNIRYPRDARISGLIGLSVFSFKVNCNDEIVDLKFATKLEKGIEVEIARQLQTLSFNWKKCDERSEDQTIEIKIAFGINRNYSPEAADIVVNAIGDFPVETDEQLIKKLNKAIEKNKYDKAKKPLEALILRYPYNTEYRKISRLLKTK